jgi:hypothetical protein
MDAPVPAPGLGGERGRCCSIWCAIARRSGQARLHAFLPNKGPWLRLDGDRPFLPGVGPKPPHANFYPAGATKAEIETWMRRPARARARRPPKDSSRPSGARPTARLQAIPYSVEYQGELERAAALLRTPPADDSSRRCAPFSRRRAARVSVQRLLRSDVAG